MTQEGQRNISFDRAVAYNDQGILCAVDLVDTSIPYRILEIKCRTDTKLLKEAMRLAMMDFPLLHITHGKEDMQKMNS